MTSIFSSSWMCRLCGREACAECFAKVRELTQYRPGASDSEIAALQAKRESHAHTNPFFLSCTRRNEHQYSDFSPMSRFDKTELEGVIESMEKLLEEEKATAPVREPVADPSVVVTSPDGPAGAPPSVTEQLSPFLHGTLYSDAKHIQDASPMILAKPLGGSTADPATASPGPSQTTINGTTTNEYVTMEGSSGIPVVVAKACGGPTSPATSTLHPLETTQNMATSNEPVTIEDPSGIPSHTTKTYTTTELTDAEFRRVWSQGAPLVVTGLGDKFGARWRPEHFREKHGSQTCSIVECQTDASKRVTLGEFFGYFGKYEGRTDTWKLKDWPSSSDFKTALPDLFDEFQKGVPMPYYSRKDGVLNIASHFPSNTVMPDLGRWFR